MSPPPPPPPPPPPLCWPSFSGGKKQRRLSYSSSPRPLTYSEKSLTDSASTRTRSTEQDGGTATGRTPGHSVALSRSGSYSPTATITSKTSKPGERLTFYTDSESYDNLEEDPFANPSKKQLKAQKKLAKSGGGGGGGGGGYGWGLGKKKTRPRSLSPPRTPIPLYGRDSLVSNVSQEKPPLVPSKSHGSHGSNGNGSPYRNLSDPPLSRGSSKRSNASPGLSRNSSKQSSQRPPLSRDRSGASGRRPMLAQIGSQDTLVGSAFERKINDVDVPKERVETSERLDLLRAQMAKDNLDYYIIPSEDAHGSEYVADWDKRREWISGFTGTAGQAIVSRDEAFLITDSRYWLQADNELDMNWKLVKIPQPGSSGGPGTWQQWLVPRVQENMRIGMDARMISYAKAAQLTKDLQARSAKLVFPPQNYVDLIWKTKPARSKEPIFIQRTSFAGQSASSKLAALREWIAEQPPSKPSYSKGPPTDAQKHVAALVTSLPNIAWILNLRGRDIPYNPVFQAYLLVNVNEGEAGGGAILFTDMGKVGDDVGAYLEKLGVEVREYNDVWNVLRRPPWGPGKVLISEETSYAISLILTHFRYTVAPSYIDSLKAVKNNVETEGLRAAHLRDGLAYTRWLAWLEDKLARGYEITEYEAAMRLTEFRRGGEYFEGLAYENISASGPNAALPHYSPTRGSAKFISRETPYLNDSGGQYLDGTIDTTRTMHFGRPTQEQCEAYTRVLQGHIAIDSCFFPQGTTGKQLDVLARKALWKEGLNYLHGTGHGFGSFLNVHEGPHGFSSDVELVPGHVITNEPGFYNEGKWGMRIESALLVRQVRTKHEFNGPIWLGFERLTVVPIQTKMVKESLLSREEIAWIKEHNRKCRERLEPLMRDVDDKRALKWLKRESERGIGVVGPGPGNISIDWD